MSNSENRLRICKVPKRVFHFVLQGLRRGLLDRPKILPQSALICSTIVNSILRAFICFIVLGYLPPNLKGALPPGKYAKCIACFFALNCESTRTTHCLGQAREHSLVLKKCCQNPAAESVLGNYGIAPEATVGRYRKTGRFLREVKIS